MSLSMMNADDLIRIASAGGGFKMNAGTKPTHDLIRIAAAASAAKVRIYLGAMSMRPVDDFISIGAASGGAVVFQDDEI
jgi:hypothetical protein